MKSLGVTRLERRVGVFDVRKVRAVSTDIGARLIRRNGEVKVRVCREEVKGNNPGLTSQLFCGAKQSRGQNPKAQLTVACCDSVLSMITSAIGL